MPPSVEVHKFDHNLYLINLHDLMPLDLPLENDPKLSIKRFRPEFLKSYQYPLSATSFFVNPLGNNNNECVIHIILNIFPD